MKKTIQLLLGLIIITSLSGCSSEKTSTVPTASEKTVSVANKTITTSKKRLTSIENDGYILYDLSYKDGLRLAGTSRPSIKIKTTGTKTIYTYAEHTLSCGTHMNGQIVENVKANIKTITGSFNVTKNPYKITDLKLCITINTETNKKTGYLIINGKQIDINSNFTSI